MESSVFYTFFFKWLKNNANIRKKLIKDPERYFPKRVANLIDEYALKKTINEYAIPDTEIVEWYLRGHTLMSIKFFSQAIERMITKDAVLKNYCKIYCSYVVNISKGVNKTVSDAILWQALISAEKQEGIESII